MVNKAVKKKNLKNKWLWLKSISNQHTLFDIVGSCEALIDKGRVSIKLPAASNICSPSHSTSVFVHQSSLYQPTMIHTYFLPYTSSL